ncbi:DNA polymerase III subunit chi [Maricurvus nonylphenolicus]|uniref:DNA polymerase III subunit chi n=1 Tax=Maricurvus nonylphenolicus TaxID=1008307 RepID=UPI0036F1D51D
MTRIDFYILPDAEEAARLHFACRLIDKARQHGLRVYVAVRDKDQAQEIDQLLWTFRPESFIPHAIQAEDLGGDNVLIGWGEQCDDHHGFLINLSDQVPGYFSRFERLAEIVCQAPDVLKSTREHYGFYRDRGYPIQSNDMRKRA